MLLSFSEFKFYQSFRIPVENADDLRFLIQKKDSLGKLVYITDGKLVDISVTGLGFKTKERISVGDEMHVSLQFKKIHLDMAGKIVRAFSNTVDDKEIIYGVEIEEDPKVNKLIEQYVSSFSHERLKDSMIQSAIRERYTKASDGLEMFSLLISLFKDITNFGDKEGFLGNMLEDAVRVMNATRASVFLINPESNELEAVCALGVPKAELKFDYRLGIAGCVFTTGVALNIDTINDRTRFNDRFDKTFGFETKSIICHPIHNGEDKIIGVIEVINKRNQDRFSIEDEKTMKVISLVFSSVFYRYNPISETSLIRRFSTPFDREFVIIGKTPHIGSIRNSILKIKDLDMPVLIEGESGVGKSLYAKIIHLEGKRGLKNFEEIDCQTPNKEQLALQLEGPDQDCKLLKAQGGTVYLREVGYLPFDLQERLFLNLSERRIPESKLAIDCRIVCSTSLDLCKMVDEGKFHRNLYTYLSKTYVFIEPLRRRIDDLGPLIDYFLKVECKKQGLLLKHFDEDVLAKMKDYDWPSNVAELRKSVERAVIYNPKAHRLTDIEINSSAAPVIDLSSKKRMFGDIPFVTDFKIGLKDRVTLVEIEMIKAEIKRNNGNKSKAAKEMGISREALRKKMLAGKSVLQELQNGHTGDTVIAKQYEQLKNELDGLEKGDALKEDDKKAA